MQDLTPYLRSKPMPAAIVVDVGWVNGLAAIRSLGRAGAPVLAVDRAGWALGFRSRYARPVLCPDPLVDEGGFVSCLQAVTAQLERPAPVFPTHDPPLNAIARNLAAFEGKLLPPFPPWDVLRRIQSKRHQLETAAAAAVPIPATAYPESAAEALAAAREHGFPVLVKPSDPDEFKRRFALQAFRCETPGELERAYADAEPYAPMVQELVPGGDDELYTLGSYLAADGEPLGLFCGRKLRQTPPGVGTCRVGEARWVDAVVEQGLTLLHALDFHGISQVEFKRDRRDGSFKLMEVNPRLWQWHGLAAACGVDVPRIAYWDLLGARLPPARQHGEGRRWAATLWKGQGVAVQRPPYVDAVLALDDLRPSLAHLARVVRGALP